MADKKNISTPVFVGEIAVVVLIVGYFLWRGAAGTPEPTPGPGQTIQNPFGNASPGRRGGTMAMPAPGTAAPGVGFGPSRGASGHMPRQ